MAFLDKFSRRLGVLEYLGTWNASTNSPSLASSIGQRGGYFVVSVNGSTSLDGITDWVAGDWAVFNGTAWQKVDNTDAPSGVTVSEIDAADAITNSLTGVHTLRFDKDTGFQVADLGDGEAKISLGSSFKTWEVEGQDPLVAVGEDTVEFIAGDNVTITTDPDSTPKSITISSSGAQGPTGDTGPAGADGKTILSGSGAPSSGTGANGDFYLNTATSDLYGPKASGSWGSPVSLIGPTGATGSKGDKGDTGDQGPQGIQGIQGIQGETGSTGLQGIQGEAGPKGDKGDTGDTGATGPQGIQGPKGDKGDTGDTGATGPQGPAGADGATAIDDAIVDGVTTRSPSQNAVYDALAAKEPTISAGTTAQYWRGDKSWQTLDKSAVGLGNVPNTDATSRANHTGTQIASTISDFASAAQTAVVAASIVNGDSTHSPSGDAVFDALALKQDAITGAATSIAGSDLTASKALVSDASGKVAASTVTATELGYVSGVTSAIQTQIGTKLGRLGAVTISPSGGTDPKLTLLASQLSGSNTSATLELWSNGTGSSVLALLNSTPDSTPLLIQRSADDLLISPSNSAKLRFSSAGHLYINSTAAANSVYASTTTAGLTYQNASFFAVSRSGNIVQYLNRITSDGSILEFRQDGVAQGSVSVSGTTVSYNAFAGSHWSQLADGSRQEILRGTVLETIDAMCEWPGEEPTERLPKCKVSDTAASKSVYGVFMDWDNDWTSTNDLYVTALGSFVCRIASGQSVQRGDLLESNGDGCARVQADDLIRSSTIGKVTSSAIINTYADGSFVVPVVLCCG